MTDIQLRVKETLFYCEGDQAFRHIAKRVCRVSIFKDIQNPTGHGPEQSALAHPANLKHLVSL